MSEIASSTGDLLKGLGIMGSGKKKPKHAPTIDEARQNTQEADRLRRRKGSLANIFGGMTGQQPTVQMKSLLGA